MCTDMEILASTDIQYMLYQIVPILIADLLLLQPEGRDMLFTVHKWAIVPVIGCSVNTESSPTDLASGKLNLS